MAKLVEILARELEEWPKAVGGDGEHPSEAMAQDGDGCLVRLDYLAVANPGQFNGEDWSRVSWCGLGHYPELADDHATAIVTRAEWQDAVDALKPDAQRFAEDYVEANKDRHVKKWDGAGLPPVGVEFEFNHPGLDKDEWVRAKVYAYPDGTHMLGVTDDPRWGNQSNKACRIRLSDDFRVRPIRTPEQIAAEEREAEVNRMVAAVPMLDKGWARKVCYALYDNNYRKQESK